MYRHWSEMERDLDEFEAAATAAEAGLELIPRNQTLEVAAGRARSLLGRQLVRELQPGAASQLMRARTHLTAALRDPSAFRSPRERMVQAQAYRSLVLTIAELLRVRARDSGAPSVPRGRELGAEALAVMERWSSEHPDDPSVENIQSTFRSRFEMAAADALSGS